ncbi:SDR family NAD(P)-dependent oxidoreductase [Synechococcus sp. HJ21-Hayes]|uniref:oxidoreductase n=1 Tax=unclassified Synechococcus TaxID=2626047 RepID=UPI0020CF4D33|nr:MULTISPECIES: oxidoreductase [unclassified Synechococcus]MCP9831262.1 SDR family NAD(P)-dependent oxidoreductase [Synechococcus sp. JJ3a-Johnson]MCP9853653.1 SDR family NAD(P)-dependent oxidoreductase [Synechococcus sp. HJ21-Hayes]
MVWTEADIPDQSGRLALVTGANSGLGLETARALAARGARVLLACRDPERGEQARQALLPIASAGIEVLAMDLADLASVARAAEQVATDHGQLDLLINNAGVMAPPRQLSRQGYELQFAVNHLGHFALTQALLPLLKARAGARVVHVSSGAHYFGRITFDDLQGERRYDAWAAYAQSKLANVMTALELQQQLEASGSTVLSVAAHPGLARTNLQPTSVAARGSRLEGLAYRLMDPLFQNAAMGALPQLYAATASDVQGGEFFGPGGLGNLKGHPVRCRLAASARDAAQRQRLWQLSEQLSHEELDQP